MIDPARVAAVVPAFDEAGKIGAVVRKVPRRLAACVIVVDDASRDGTAEEARSAGAERVISHPRIAAWAPRSAPGSWRRAPPDSSTRPSCRATTSTSPTSSSGC